MANTIMMTSTMGNDQFYPTPPKLAGMMLSGVDWKGIQTILEPSAGKGDLLMAAAKAFVNNTRRERSNRSLEADCIEIDPYLRQILAYNFTDESIKHMRDRYRELDREFWKGLTQAEKEEHKRLGRAIKPVDATDLLIVHDDFLTFRGRKKYDLILMNPPFADGDKHLLKALDIQKDGGMIICLLNAETIRNPLTRVRQLLLKKLKEVDADITYVKDAFKYAERTTDVEVAVIRVNIPKADEQAPSGIYERMKRAHSHEFVQDECTDLTTGGYIEMLVQQYEIEVAAGMELIKEYLAMRPYMLTSFPSEHNRTYNIPILELRVGDYRFEGTTDDYNRYLQRTRGKFWAALLNNEAIIGRLTSKLRQEYSNSVGKMADYDFSLFNVKMILAEINSRITEGVKSSIMGLFDTLTSEYSWYPESKNNIHYFNGWASNRAHKIGKKSIIPSNGIYSTCSYTKRDEFRDYEAHSLLSDIEKVFNYLDGRMTEEVNLRRVLERAKVTGQTKNIQCKYFAVDFYKKGTVHIKYTDTEIVDRLNIYAAQNRNWLPPYYGKTEYKDMCEEGKAIVDDFQGEKAYKKVMEDKVFFLAEVGGVAPTMLLQCPA